MIVTHLGVAVNVNRSSVSRGRRCTRPFHVRISVLQPGPYVRLLWAPSVYGVKILPISWSGKVSQFDI